MHTRKLYLSLLLSFLITPLFAQFEFGVKGGVNYDSFGDLNPTDVSLASFEADAKTAFHVGVYSKIDLLLFPPFLMCTRISGIYATLILFL